MIPNTAPILTSTHPTSNLSNPRVVVLADNLPGPDDLAIGADGSIYISDVSDGTVKQYTPDGKLRVVVSGLSEPEGILILIGGSLLIAEQGKNQLVRYDLQTKTLTLFLNLTNKTHQLGVDGIALDAHTLNASTLIIPDSPNGTILRSSLDGKALTEIARGFARPTSAWVEADGFILVTDENAGTLSRIHPDGTVEKLADLPIPDDVVEDEGGNIFVATLGDGAVHVIPAGTKQETILVSGLGSPQGLVCDTQGNLIVTDPGHHRLIKIFIEP